MPEVYDYVPYLPIGELWPGDEDWDPSATPWFDFILDLQRALQERGYLTLEGMEPGIYNRTTAIALRNWAVDHNVPLVYDAWAGCEVYQGLGVRVNSVRCFPGVTDKYRPEPTFSCSELPSKVCGEYTPPSNGEKPPIEKEGGIKRILPYALIGSAAVLTAWGISRRT